MVIRIMEPSDTLEEIPLGHPIVYHPDERQQAMGTTSLPVHYRRLAIALVLSFTIFLVIPFVL